MIVPATVVITNRDYGRFLREAVDSALAQVEVEVIVVDDGSTDDSGKVLARFGRRIRVVHLDGQGQGAAMNAGFHVSQGDPVLFLDADDRLAPGVVDAVRSVLTGDVARVHFPLRRIDAEGTPTGGTVPPACDRLVAGDLRAAVVAHGHDLPWQPTTGNAYRRSVLDAILPLPAEAYRTCADHYLNALSALHGPVERLTTVGGDYRIHGRNADARTTFDIERTRGILERAEITTALVRAEAGRLGLVGRERGSISVAANRLLSLRLDRPRHPVAGDTVSRAWRDGVRAVIGRNDVTPGRSLLAAGLLSALAVAPRFVLPALADRYVTGSTDPGRSGTTASAPARDARIEVPRP